MQGFDAGAANRTAIEEEEERAARYRQYWQRVFVTMPLKSRGKMTSELQKRANRANAQKSTGPKSEAGKSVVRLNATRHGLLSRAPVAIGEDASEYDALCVELSGELAPVGTVETQLVARIASAMWRLRRVGHIEAGVLTGYAAGAYAAAADEVAQSHTRTEGGMADILESLNDARTVVTDEVAHRDATEAAVEARQVLHSESALLGAAYINDASGADALTKLARYEKSIEHGLYRAHDELQRLQEKRKAAE